jgi:AcrR family transcriptional regulator
MVPMGTVSRGFALPTAPKKNAPALAESPLRRRILDAAFSAFTEDGYAAASTLEIATRAKVSKRDLYTVAGSKHDLLVACITERAAGLSASAELPLVQDRPSLEHALVTLGEKVVRTAGHPNAIAMFRLAVAEAERAPEIARALESIAREASRASLRQILNDALAQSLLSGDVPEMVETFMALLFGNLQLSWLLRVSNPPGPREVELRAQRATEAFFKLYLR